MLWPMYHGKQQSERKLVVAHVALIASIFGEDGPGAKSLDHFIRTGSLAGGDRNADVMPYDPAALKQIVESGVLTYGGQS